MNRIKDIYNEFDGQPQLSKDSDREQPTDTETDCLQPCNPMFANLSLLNEKQWLCLLFAVVPNSQWR
jgi:hypothetical protein